VSLKFTDMKKIMMFMASIMTSVALNAQVFEQGSNHLNLGYGVGLGYGRLLNAYSANQGYKFSGFGPAFVNYERALTDRFGLGLAVSYSSYGGKWVDGFNYDYSYRWSTLSIMARGAYHFEMRNDKFDPYVGVGIGFLKYGYKWTSNDPSFNEANYNVSLGTPFGYQIFAGARYMFSDKIGAYAEVGYGLSVANFGLTFKL
jgi:opacity protein-like surface antigen